MVAKYAGDINPSLWLKDYHLACQAGGVNNDLIIILQLLLYLADSTRVWLENLPKDQNFSLTNLREVFVGNFHATYVPGICKT